MNRDKELADKYLVNFGRLMRITLNNSDKVNIPLSEEIHMLRLYLNLEKVRFDEYFDYELSKDDNLITDDVRIPPMLIQPYVENAIRHGLRNLGKGKKGHLFVGFGVENELLVCTIDDNGIGREKAGKLKNKLHVMYQSQGLTLTGKRLEALTQFHRKSFKVEIIDKFENGKATGRKVIVSIPFDVVYVKPIVNGN